MSTDTHQITVSGLRVAVVRKKIKNLHLGVYPPQGRVRVAAPVNVSNEAIRLAVVNRLAWIKRQRAKFETQPRQTARSFVSGETHFYLGKRYRLNLIEGARSGGVHIRNSRTIDLSVRTGSDQSVRERVFYKWYREQLRNCATTLIELTLGPGLIPDAPDPLVSQPSQWTSNFAMSKTRKTSHRQRGKINAAHQGVAIPTSPAQS